jgi:hypothetical protein
VLRFLYPVLTDGSLVKVRSSLGACLSVYLWHPSAVENGNGKRLSLRVMTHGIIDLRCGVARTWERVLLFEDVSCLKLDVEGFMGLGFFLVPECLASDFR